MGVYWWSWVEGGGVKKKLAFDAVLHFKSRNKLETAPKVIVTNDNIVNEVQVKEESVHKAKNIELVTTIFFFVYNYDFKPASNNVFKMLMIRFGPH